MVNLTQQKQTSTHNEIYYNTKQTQTKATFGSSLMTSSLETERAYSYQIKSNTNLYSITSC